MAILMNLIKAAIGAAILSKAAHSAFNNYIKRPMEGCSGTKNKAIEIDDYFIVDEN